MGLTVKEREKFGSLQQKEYNMLCERNTPFIASYVRSYVPLSSGSHSTVTGFGVEMAVCCPH